MADERTRYSDAELEEFKQLILKKLENARADYELLRIPPRRSKSSKRAQRPSRKRRADVWRHTR